MRKGKIKRKTRETNISVEMELDGVGRGEIDTKIPFMDHMLNLLARHGLFDLKISGQGDREVDDHHLVEDLGICLGNAVKKALGDKEGIARYGAALAPMDESLASVALDISGRPCLVYHAGLGEARIGPSTRPCSGSFSRPFPITAESPCTSMSSMVRITITWRRLHSRPLPWHCAPRCSSMNGFRASCPRRVCSELTYKTPLF